VARGGLRSLRGSRADEVERPRGRATSPGGGGSPPPSSRELARGGRNGPSGRRVRGSVGGRLWRGASPGEQGPGRRFGGGAVRLRGGKKASKRTKPASRQVGGAFGPGCRGCRQRGNTRAAETAPEALAGIQATTPHGVRVGETRSNKAERTTAGLTSVDNRKGAEAAPRGVRDPDEEQRSGGKNPRDGCGMRQGREARVCWRTAEGLRKPGSGP